MILAILTLSALFALFYPQPPNLIRYIYSRLYGNVILFAVNHFWHDTSLIFAIAFGVVNIVILGCISGIVLEAVRTRQNSWRATGIVAVLSVTLARLGFVLLGHPAHYWDYMGIIEGSFLFGTGLTLGCLAWYVERTDLALVLSGLWLAQGYFRIGFYLHLPSWGSLNWVLPPAVGVVSFLLIGWLGRQRIYGKRLIGAR